MLKTAVENNQNLIVEGCYIPFDWAKSFHNEYLDNIRYLCLVMSENYIRKHFLDIKDYANVIEKRMEDNCTVESVIEDNVCMLKYAQEYGVEYVLIDEEYDIISQKIIDNIHK
jgi:2-phosphoglycerate kinase